MADVINLRKARKNKLATEKDARAQENRVVFGRSKSQRSLEEARSVKQRRTLDAHRRQDKS